MDSLGLVLALVNVVAASCWIGDRVARRAHAVLNRDAERQVEYSMERVNLVLIPVLWSVASLLAFFIVVGPLFGL